MVGGGRRRGGQRGEIELGGLELFTQPPIISRFFLGIEQADFGRGNLVEDLLRQSGVRARLIALDLAHPTVGRVGNHIGIRLEGRNRQQAVVMGRLLFGRDPEPFPIGIECISHSRMLTWAVCNRPRSG